MPIKLLALQRRFAEQGRIRLGDQVPTTNGKTRPNKLEAFRFTSPSERHINDLAELYGGEAKAWDNNGKPEFEVYSKAKSIPVIVVKGGLSQWLETWSGGGCTHRCDGETNVLTNERCNPEDPNHLNAKPTTRLSLMLPELESIGVWRMESHGWNAAAEIPAVAELAQFVGDLVPAHLNLIERRAVKDGKTSRFVVPVLDLQIGSKQLTELVNAKMGGAPALEAATGQRPALAAGSSTPADGEDAFTKPLQLIAEATDHARLVWVWDTARAEGIIGPESESSDRRSEFVAAWKARAHEIQATNGDAPAVAAQPNADGTFDAEIVDDDADAIWQQKVVPAAGQRGMDLEVLVEDFKARMGGLLPDDATAGELQAYLDELAKEPAA